MSRARIPVDRLSDQAGNSIQNAAVYVYQPGTQSQVVVYNARSGGSVLTQPVLTDANGEVEMWVATAQTVDVRFTDNSGTAFKPARPKRTVAPFDLTETMAADTPPEDATGGYIPYFTPESHGAVGDGVTDDSAAIQAAIDAAFSAGGGEVVYSKLYGSKATIHGKTNVTHRGTSRGATGVKAIATFVGTALFDSASGSGMQQATLETMTWNGNGLVATVVATTSPAGQPGHNHIDNCNITGGTTKSVELGGATSPVGYECHIANSDTGGSPTGIHMTGTDCHISDNNMGSITVAGIQLDGGGCQVHDNHIVTNGTSAWCLKDTAGAVNDIHDNYFDSSGPEGQGMVLIQPTTGRTATDSALRNNEFYAQNLNADATYYAITLDATNGSIDDYAIEGNIGRAKGGARFAGIVTTVGSPSNWSLKNNRFVYCASLGSLAPDLGVNEIYDGTTYKIGRPRQARTTTTQSGGGTKVLDAMFGDEMVISVTDATAFTVGTPTNPVDGMPMTVVIANASGGVMGAVTWNSSWKLAGGAGPAVPANGKEIFVTFKYSNSDSKWHERGRSTGDI